MSTDQITNDDIFSRTGQDQTDQLMSDIQNLQNIEQKLFSSLEQETMSTAQKQDIIQKINDISQIRIQLYKSLTKMSDYFQNSLSSSRNTLFEQTEAVKIVEEELNEAKRRLELIDEEKVNKVRLVEINKYYGDRYSEHSTIMKIIIVTLVPILILTILAKKNIIPSMVYSILSFIIGLIGFGFLIVRFISIFRRDNMNYQAYDYSFDTTTGPDPDKTDTSDPWAPNPNLSFECIGPACCNQDSTYDFSLNICVANGTAAASNSSNNAPTIENMMNQYFTKDNNNNVKPNDIFHSSFMKL